ncbi:TnsA-like heteromeric transposase endonuclease subunit [Streptomyces sp. NBC_01089]|uniref:TnsA-like heteromeric transposase endonuclease subunit n=1 Tax=Streptomyces sp. NBC_01089 TaxID=2903747 RepID=UPI003864BEA2|nr:TnsA-like heteromeric transposase endonuclease subunit [Streptomyces sp. NBC_01089]
MTKTELDAPVRVSVRQADELVAEDLEWGSVPLDLLRDAQPWRTFRWFKGQRHYSGTYWSSTVRDHVIYESRLELARLLFADFARDVRHVVAQPFLLKAEVEGQLRRHIPDFLLMTDGGPVVVDVKPRHRLEREGRFLIRVDSCSGYFARVALRGLERAGSS